jgi:hypothetical protein
VIEDFASCVAEMNCRPGRNLTNLPRSGQGRAIAFAVPGRYTVKATLDGNNLVEKVEAVLSNPVVGDMPMEVVYADYRDFGGVKFPTRIRQAAGGFPAADFTVSDVKPNAAVDIQVPDSIRQAKMPYARVASEQVADGVWYVTGGTHHGVVIEMKDHIIVVEATLNERATAVIAEARRLAPGKPIRPVTTVTIISITRAGSGRSRRRASGWSRTTRIAHSSRAR